MNARKATAGLIAFVALMICAVWLFAPNVLGGAMLSVFGWIGKSKYLWIEVPAIRDEIKNIPGVTLENVEDVAPPDEVGFHLTFNIKNKGTITFYNPQRTGFVGTNDFLTVVAIDTCRLDSYLGIGAIGQYADLRYINIVAAFEEYDAIYAFVREKELCRP